jgi:rhodanese-related sulfurtransferase
VGTRVRLEIRVSECSAFVVRVSDLEAYPVAHQHSPAFLSIVQDAKSRVKECTVEDVKARLDRGERFTLIDVREESEWAAGRIPGAVHLSKGVIERDIERAVPDKAASLVLYCGGGFRSALAADNLRKMGYTDVISMDGGMRGWREKKYPEAK